MGDRDRRPAALKALEGGLDEPLADRVEGRRCLVEDEDPRVLEEDAGDRHRAGW
jgi:hypothetical protein